MKHNQGHVIRVFTGVKPFVVHSDAEQRPISRPSDVTEYNARLIPFSKKPVKSRPLLTPSRGDSNPFETIEHLGSNAPATSFSIRTASTASNDDCPHILPA